MRPTCWSTGRAALIGRVLSSDKDRQVTIGGADIRAAHRRIEHLDAAHAQGFGYFNRQLRRRAAQIDKYQVVLIRVGDAVFAAGDFFNISRLQRRQDDGRPVGNFGRCSRAARALAYERF